MYLLVQIRNALKDSEAVKQWGKKEFWNTYSDAHVLCGLLEVAKQLNMHQPNKY